MPTPSRSRIALLVAGMHRSGSSALGGVLAHLGAQRPKSLMPPTKDNPRGYWESMAFMQFHDRVLASAGSTWNDWSPFNPRWLDSPVAAEYVEALPGVIAAEFGDASLMMVKDPRICRLLPLWRTVLRSTDVDAKIVMPIRHPLEVASSLEARDGFVPARSVLLWLRHVLAAEHDSRGLARVVVAYPELLADWRTQMRRVAEALDLRWPKWSVDSEVAIDQFLSSRLRHHAEGEAGAGQPQLAAWAAATFAALERLAGDSDDAGALAALDAVRAELDASSVLFAAVARETELRAASERRQREREQAEAAKRVAGLEEEFREQETTHAAELAAAKQERGVALADLQVRLAASERVMEQLRRERESALQVSETTQATLRDQLAVRDARVADLHLRLATSEHALDQAGREREAAQRSHEVALDALRGQIAASEQRIEGLAAELATKDMEIAERFSEIASLTRLLTQKEHAVEQAEIQHRTLTAALDKQKARSAVLEKELADARKRATSTQRALSAAQVQLLAGEKAQQHQMAELARLQTSLSWRITAPLRRVGRIGRHLKKRPGFDAGDLELVRAADLFDARWYLDANPDVAAAGMDPVLHYVLHGGQEGRDPGPRFASRRYLETYPDVATAGMNPLVHYLRYGRAEGRTIPEAPR